MFLEPRVDEEVDLLGLSDDALDEDDFNDAVDELDRADETDEQADPSDRRSYRWRRFCPPGYKRRGWYRCTRDTKSTTSYYMVLDGKRYKVTPSSGRLVNSDIYGSRGTMEIGGAKYTVTLMRRRWCRGWKCWRRG